MKKNRLILFGLLCLGLTSCGPKETIYHEADMITDNTHPLVMVELSQKDTVAFLVDTGSDFTVINEFYYNSKPELFRNKKVEKATVVTINGVEEYDMVSVSGSLNGINATMSVMNVNSMTQLLSARNKVLVVGILGSDFFRRHDAILDFQNNKLITREYVKVKANI